MPKSPPGPVATTAVPRTAAETAALDKRVRRYLGGGPLSAQTQRLEELLAQVDAPNSEYSAWLECAARVYELQAAQTPFTDAARQSPELRPALIYAYLGQLALARALLPESCQVQRAHLRLWEAEAAQEASPQAQLYAQAGDELAQAGRPVLAALAYQAAGRLDAARGCFAQLLTQCQGLPYQQALVRVNLCLVCAAAGAEHRREAQQQAAAAQQLLEELSDEAEARGERERAMDCQKLLIHLGQTLGRFENIAEGYLNSIRLLKEEQLRLHALRYYEDFARVGSELGEHHTVAQVCREAADYQSGLDHSLRRHYQRRAAQAAVAAAEQLQARGGAAALCEQAYLLAIDSWNRLDDLAQVGACFAALAALPLPAGRQQRYARLYSKYPAAEPTPERAEALPAFLQKPQPYPPVWLLDLVEWEAGGEPTAVCLALLGDIRRPDLTRRHALRVLLLSHAPPATGPAAQQRLLCIADSLANLRTYEAMRPLERLYVGAQAAAQPAGSASAAPPPELRTLDRAGSVALRSALLLALPKLPYKRALYLVLRGIAEPDAGLHRDALESLSRFHFADAIAPLCRLFRERADADVRRAVLHSLGRAHDLRAGEFLLEVIRQSDEPLRSEAQRQLLRYEHPELVPLIRRSLDLDSGSARPLLEALLSHLSSRSQSSAF